MKNFRTLNTILMAIIAIFSIGGLMMGSSASAAEAPETLGNPVYINPTPGKIPLIASSPVTDVFNPTYDEFVGVRECGFNGAITRLPQANINKCLDFADKCDLKLILYNSVVAEARETINRYGDKEGLGAWIFIDEPKYANLPTLGREYKRIRGLDKSKMTIINLACTAGRAFVGSSPNYRSYLDTIQKVFTPPVWSYDFYPFFYKDGKPDIRYDTFYSSLEDFKSISKATNRPFWTYLQTMEYAAGGYLHPAITEPRLRYTAFTSLAYGAQGLLFWTYCQRKSTDAETYGPALVNLDGKRTPGWYAAKRINSEIALYNDIFLDTKVLDLRHAGKERYSRTRRLVGGFGPMTSITTGDDGVIASHLRTKGVDYLVIVNRSSEKSQKIRIVFSPNMQVEELKVNKKATALTVTTPKSTMSRKLDSGGYMVFRYKAKTR